MCRVLSMLPIVKTGDLINFNAFSGRRAGINRVLFLSVIAQYTGVDGV